MAAELHPSSRATSQSTNGGHSRPSLARTAAPVDWNALGCKSDLPGFVNDTGYRNFKFRLAGTVRMETPVMYFYSPREVTASVKVQFPRGVITEWYPNGDNAIYESKRLMDQMGAATRSPFYSENAVYETKRLIDPPPSGLDPLMVKLSPSLNGIDTSLRNLTGAIELERHQSSAGLTCRFSRRKAQAATMPRAERMPLPSPSASSMKNSCFIAAWAASRFLFQSVCQAMGK